MAQLDEIPDSFVMTKNDMIATLTAARYDDINPQLWYRTPDGAIHPVGITIIHKGMNTVLELTDVATAKKIFKEDNQ